MSYAFHIEIAGRASARAAESATDAGELAALGRLEDALDTVRESQHHLQTMEEALRNARIESGRLNFTGGK